MKPSLYLETTIPSFLVGDISQVLITAGHQAVTRQWWEEKRDQYDLYISAVVIDELQRGKSIFSKQRLQLVTAMPRLEVTPDVIQLATVLNKRFILSPAAETDVLHVALACYYEMDFLLTWNLKHIANGQVIRNLTFFHNETGTHLPIICTPDELLERNDEL
jgi:hypothetical protein